MSFPQSALEKWAKDVGESHGEWIVDVIASAYNAGYTEAYPHAAKHTVEKVIEILREEERKAIESIEARPCACQPILTLTVDEIEEILKKKEKWTKCQK